MYKGYRIRTCDSMIKSHPLYHWVKPSFKRTNFPCILEGISRSRIIHDGQTAIGEVKAIANCLENKSFLRSSNLLLSEIVILTYYYSTYLIPIYTLNIRNDILTTIVNDFQNNNIRSSLENDVTKKYKNIVNA